MYGGGGVEECWDILDVPNTKYGNWKRFDLMMQLVYAYTRYYRKNKSCKQPFDHFTQNFIMKECFKEKYGDCVIEYVPGLLPDFTNYNYLGYP